MSKGGSGMMAANLKLDMKSTNLAAISFATSMGLAPASRADVGYQFVTVGNAGNANDSTGYGGVGYAYAIGTRDVTVAEYTDFLNSVAQTDTYSLYAPQMTNILPHMAVFQSPTPSVAGIARSGSSGSFTYSVIGNGQQAVTWVSWFDAARFTNWLHNGQPTGLGEVAASTEQGAYTLNGDTDAGGTTGTETKNANAEYWIPSENEWYKAAYYDPNKGGPGDGGYWQSPAGAYGTHGQEGGWDDLAEWNDEVLGGRRRGLRGGRQTPNANLSSYRDATWAAVEYQDLGFRVATVPEPGTAVSFALAGGLLLARRKRIAPAGPVSHNNY